MNARGSLAAAQPNAHSSAAASLFAAGSGYDYLILTSETGYATLLRYELDEPPVPTRTSLLSSEQSSANTFVAPSLRGRFIKVSEVCVGRSGARLTCPGARVAVDASGGAILLTSLMRNKVVLPVRRTDFGLSPSSSAVGGGASALAWLGAGSSTSGGGSGGGFRGFGGSDEDEDNEEDSRQNGNQRAKSSLAKTSQDESLLGRQLARRVKKMQAPRGLIMLGSPIEAHRQTVIFSACALDGFVDTSVFAVLEQETVEARDAPLKSEVGSPPSVSAPPGGPRENKHGSMKAASGESKYLVVYAYVPSLQQVQRTHLVRLPATAHRLVPIPAAPFGPGGVLVCTDSEVIWYDLSPSAYFNNNATSSSNNNSNTSAPATGVFKCSAPLPRRAAFTDTLYDPSIIAHTVTCVRKDFFMLLQDEQGDLFRVFLSRVSVQQAYDSLKAARVQQQQPSGSAAAAPHVVNPLSVHYFDTIAPASDLSLFPRGFLLAAAETGPFHGLYKIIRDGYGKESEYIVKRVKRVRELPAAVADTKRQREDDEADEKVKEEAEESHASGVKKEDAHDIDDRKPKATGKLVALLQQQQPAAAAKAPPTTQTITRVIAIYQPHQSLKHLALVQTYPNTPPVVSFTSAIPTSTAAAAGGGGSSAASAMAPAPPGMGSDSSSVPAATASSQPQMQFNLVAGRGAGSVLLNARFGYATRRESRFPLPFASESVFALLSASALQRLVRELEAAVAQAQALMDASSASSILGSGGHGGSDKASSLSGKAVRMKTLQKLLATSSNRASALWTDKLLITTGKGTTAPYHVSRAMEPDWWTGFTTAERTLAAATLKYGIGYVQVTPKAIYVLSPTLKEDRERERRVGEAAPSTASSAAFVQPTTWTHRHGKMILAAAATPTTVLLAFAQGGGLASFSFGLTGTQLEKMEDLPTFPTSPAVSLLQPSPESLMGASTNAQLNAFLFGAGGGRHRHASSAAAVGVPQDELELAAIATMAQEVYIINPKKLREPIDKINCQDVGSGNSHHSNATEEMVVTNEDGTVSRSNSGAIVSVLLTYLGGGTNAYAKNVSAKSGSKGSGSVHNQQQRGRRLFCFIGHMNGILTRCELDPVTAKVIDRDELTCGVAPCKMISGDGQSVCYIQSGAHAWRCEVRDGVAKIVPWRFPSKQHSFAYFLTPLLLPPSTASPSPAAVKKEEEEADNTYEEEEDEKANGASLTFITAAATSSGTTGSGAGGGAGLRAECVVAVQGSELTLFSAQKSGSGASSLEYSFTPHSLPLAGRRILQHTTDPAYFILLSTEHRGYSIADIKAMRAERQQQMKLAGSVDPTAAAAAVRGPISLDAPQRALGHADFYNSTLQLYHEESNRVFPRYFFTEGEAVLCGAVGSFVEDFGREPVLVVGAASQYSHGAGCGGGGGWSQGWLCAFHFTRQQQQQQQQQQPGGKPMLRIEALHRTFIRSDVNPKTGTPYPADYPSAVHICEDVGLLFVGLGEEHGLRIYVWGQHQFLRKRHLPNVPSRILAIQTAWVAPPPGSATTNTSSNFLSDLYHIPFNDRDAPRRARENRLLIYCATASHSVLVASLQSGNGSNNSSGSTASFLMVVARDPIPRHLTASLVVLRDGRTAAVADKFGNVTFLRVPIDNRNGFSLPVGDMRDAQLSEAEAYIAKEQFLDEVASHATGQVVTALQKQFYDPSNGTDPALAIEMVVYSTALGAVGAYVPFVSEADAALAAYAQPLLAKHMRTLLASPSGALPSHLRGHLTSTAGTVPGHHVIEGDLFHVYRHQQLAAGLASPDAARGAASTAASFPSSLPPTVALVTSAVFSPEAKAAVEEELQRARQVESARRRVLGLPPRELPELTDLIAKQRALASLPQ